jgi:hypothetical protein
MESHLVCEMPSFGVANLRNSALLRAIGTLNLNISHHNLLPPEAGAVDLSYSSLLHLKWAQSRRDARVIVALLPSIATQSEAISGSARRAETRIAPGGVIGRSERVTTPRFLCLAGSQSWSQQRRT